MKVQVHNSSEPPMKYNQNQMKAGKIIPESSRLEFSEKITLNSFPLPDAKDNTSGPLNIGRIEDLSLFRMLLARKKPREPNFWEWIDSFLLA